MKMREEKKTFKRKCGDDELEMKEEKSSDVRMRCEIRKRNSFYKITIFKFFP